MKADELLLLNWMRLAHALPNLERPRPRDFVNASDCPINHKRVWYILEKWSRLGWYEYGVTLDLGWLTEAGYKAALEHGDAGIVAMLST